MAISTATYSQKGGYEDIYVLYAKVIIESQDVSACTSKVSITLTAKSTNSNYGAYDTTGNSPVKLVVNGNTVINKKINMDFRNQTTVSLGSWSGTISHDTSTGKKDLSFSASFYVDGSSYIGRSYQITLSKTIALPTIARSSTIGDITSTNSFNIGGKFTIPINRKNTSYKHKIIVSIGNTSLVSVNDIQASSYIIDTSSSHSIEKWCSAIPNATSATVNVAMNTYNGTVKIGETQRKTFTVKVPSNITPSIDSITITDGTTNYKDVGAYVQDQSIASISISASGKYGSSIKKYETTFCGKTYNGNSILETVSKSGTLDIVSKITDSRGRIDSKTSTITVVPYSYPSISSFTVSRCNSDGTVNQNGACLKPIITFSSSPVKYNNTNHNSVQVNFYYKTPDASDYSMTTVIPDIFDGTASTVISSTSTELSYICYAEISDSFSLNIGTGLFSVASTFSLLHLSDDGTGIAMGKVADITNTLDVNLQAIFRKKIDLLDDAYIKCSGTNNARRIYCENLDYKNNTGSSNSHPHSIYFGMGNSSSNYGFELYDYVNKKWVMTYDDVNDKINFGSNVSFPLKNVLWSGTVWPDDTQTVNFSERVYDQAYGIVLVFSRYDSSNSKVVDDNFVCKYIPKKLVYDKSGVSHTIPLFSANFNNASVKFIYIYDRYLKGHANNVNTGTANSGIKYNNKYFCLRYVLGV